MNEDLQLREPAPTLPAGAPDGNDPIARATLCQTGSASYRAGWLIGVALLAGLLLGVAMLIGSLLWLVPSPMILAVFVFIAVLHQSATAAFGKWSSLHYAIGATLLDTPMLVFGLIIAPADPFLLQFAISLILIPCCWQPLVRWFWAWRDIAALARDDRTHRLGEPPGDPPADATADAIVRDAAESDLSALREIVPNANHLQRIGTGPQARYLVVELAGRVVGFGRVVLERLPNRPHMPVPWICNLNVHPDFRGRGLGSMLIAELESVALVHGHRIVHIGASSIDARACSLYRRLGYDPIEPPDADRRNHVIYLARQIA